MKRQLLILVYFFSLGLASFGKPSMPVNGISGDPGNGKYYSTQPGVQYIMISNCCDAGPIGYKVTNASGTIEYQYKKSYYVQGLFYNPRNNDFLYIYNEKNVILDFTAPAKNGGKDHDFKAVDILSTDENVKTMARDTYMSKIVEVMAEQRKKKKEDEDAAYKKKVAERKAPVDKMKNPELTKQALARMNAHALNENYGYSYTKAYIVSEDWWIVKHEYTGAILKRTIEVAVLYQKDNKCFLEYFSLAQDYTGSGFQKTLLYDGIMMNHDGGGDEIDCNKVK